MKNLIDILEFVSKDTILEKLSIDDIVVANKFPIYGSIQEIEDFLKRNGFQENDYDPEIPKWKTRIDAFNKANGLSYIKGKAIKWIRFADTSKKKIGDADSNPTYTIFFISDTISYYLEGKDPKQVYKPISAEEFLKAINKRFGWK